MKKLFILLFVSAALVFTGCENSEEANEKNDLATDNEEVVRQYIDAYNNQDLDALRDLLAASITLNENEMERDDFLGIVQDYWNSFPDIELDPSHLAGADDYVATQMKVTATGDGEYYGYDIDGVSVEVTETILFQISDNQIDGYIYDWDELGFWIQLGVLESPYPEE